MIIGVEFHDVADQCICLCFPENVRSEHCERSPDTDRFQILGNARDFLEAFFKASVVPASWLTRADKNEITLRRHPNPGMRKYRMEGGYKQIEIFRQQCVRMDPLRKNAARPQPCRNRMVVLQRCQ